MSKLFIKTSFLMLVVIFSSMTVYSEENNNQPIQIEADNMKYFGEKNMSLFTGNVVVSNDSMKMTSDKMEVFFTEDKEVKEIFSRGNVKIEREGLTALAGQAHVFQKEQKIILSENARIWQGENYLEGEKVTLFNESDMLFVDKGDDDKRVKIIIAPNKEN